jgi:excisionase family DNA binding protein
VPDYLTPDEVASLLRVERRTLDQWRYRKQGPAYVRAEGTIRYPRTEVETYLAARTVNAR